MLIVDDRDDREKDDQQRSERQRGLERLAESLLLGHAREGCREHDHREADQAHLREVEREADHE